MTPRPRRTHQTRLPFVVGAVASSVLACEPPPSSPTCRSAYRPDWAPEDYETARDLALIELARCDPPWCDVTIARCGSFDKVSFSDGFVAQTSYHLGADGRTVAALFCSDVPGFCGGASPCGVWADTPFFPMLSAGCAPDCYYDGTGEPACAP